MHRVLGPDSMLPPRVCGFSPGISVNNVGNFLESNLEQPLCTRGQYVTQDDHSRSLDVIFTEGSSAVIHKTLQIKLICVLCTKEGLSFQHFLHRNPASSLLRGLLRWLSGFF